MVVASGGAEYDYDFIGGLRDAGVTYYSMEGALALRDALREFRGGGTIVTVAVEAMYKCPAE